MRRHENSDLKFSDRSFLGLGVREYPFSTTSCTTIDPRRSVVRSSNHRYAGDSFAEGLEVHPSVCCATPFLVFKKTPNNGNISLKIIKLYYMSANSFAVNRSCCTSPGASHAWSHN
jgi:hypothetical protein